jgi:hypothetical protein
LKKFLSLSNQTPISTQCAAISIYPVNISEEKMWLWRLNSSLETGFFEKKWKIYHCLKEIGAIGITKSLPS